MTGPSNAVMGDLDDPTIIPETSVPEEELTEEKKLAKYSKTAEFKRLKDYMEQRIEFYQRYLPNGSLVEGDPKDGRAVSFNLPQEDLNVYWRVACLLIREFQNVLLSYENAAETVKDGR